MSDSSLKESVIDCRFLNGEKLEPEEVVQKYEVPNARFFKCPSCVGVSTEGVLCGVRQMGLCEMSRPGVVISNSGNKP